MGRKGCGTCIRPRALDKWKGKVHVALQETNGTT